MDIKNIIFDFGGVLVDWNPRYVYTDIFEEVSEMEYFLANICTNEWNTQQDAGRSLAEGTAILQRQFPEYETLIGYYYGRWEAMLKGAIAENVALLTPLSEKYRLFGLTNWSAETFPVALDRFSFFRKFEGIVVSGEEKMIKPDKALFHVILRRYQLKAEESVFIDDTRKNIDAAHAMGFHTVHLHDGVSLEAELKRMNVL